MKIHNCIPLENQDEWNSALMNINHSYFHTWENCFAMNKTTHFKTFLYLFEHNGIKIACPLSERIYKGFTDIVTPYGFSGFAGNKDYPEFKNYWNEFVREKKYVCGYISLNPTSENVTYFEEKDAYISTNLYFIDLRKSLTELFENLDSNRKRQIINYKKAESGFKYDRKILTDFLLGNYPSYLKRINASQANFFTDETLKEICNSENVYLAGAGDNGKVEAVYVFGYTEFEGNCLLNVATPEGRQYSPLLLWNGLKFFRSKKIPLMNLGGGIKEDDSVALSKERFGAYKLSFKNLKQVYDEINYEKLCAIEKVISKDRAGYFPAYRKNLTV